MTVEARILHRLSELTAAAPGERVIIGITGPPGAGKTTLAEQLVQLAGPAGRTVAHVPMDGFHLSNRELERLGRRGRKGAIDTFDADGYVAAIRRIRDERDHIVYLPAFERELDDPVAGSIAVLPGAGVVVTEGNYLLDTEHPWSQLRELLSETWYVESANRREQLLRRHIRFGKTPEQARAWIDEVDEPNAQRIERGRDASDLVVDLTPSP